MSGLNSVPPGRRPVCHSDSTTGGPVGVAATGGGGAPASITPTRTTPGMADSADTIRSRCTKLRSAAFSWTTPWRTVSDGTVTRTSRSGPAAAYPSSHASVWAARPADPVLPIATTTASAMARCFITALSVQDGEEACGGALRARDLVERCGEVDSPRRQRRQVGEPFHDDDAGAQDHPVHWKVLRREIG